MRRQLLIATVCACSAGCIQFGEERPPLRPALLVNHAEHLTVIANDSEDVLRIELEVDYFRPSWCPRFSLQVTVNGERAEPVEDAYVGAVSRGPGRGHDCMLPAFKYPFDPAQPSETLRIEVSDRSFTLVAEVEAPADVAHIELDHDVVMAGELVKGRLVPEPRMGSQVWIHVKAQGEIGGTSLYWQGGDLSIEIPKRASPGEGEVNVAISDWVALPVNCEGPKSCRMRLNHILARSEERWQAQTTFTVE
jgi:hypothetical protein